MSVLMKVSYFSVIYFGFPKVLSKLDAFTNRSFIFHLKARKFMLKIYFHSISISYF